MSEAKREFGAADRHAKSIAKSLAKGRPVARTPDLDRYLADSPEEVFAAFKGVVRHMPPAGDDEALAFGYLFLLQALLEHLRYGTDRGDVEAATLIAKFQADVAGQRNSGEIDGRLLAYVAGALHQAKIPVSSEFAAASAQQDIGFETASFPADVGIALEGAFEACGGDPFALVGALAEVGHAMPEQARGALAFGLAISNRSQGRAAAVLFLLDSSPVVRRMAIGALDQAAASLSPTELRRLIAIRDWRPENERAEIDAVIRKARASGIPCAQWEAGEVETILATAIDGVGAQGFLLVSPAGRKKRLSSILTKGGIADAWSGEPESLRRVRATLAGAGMDAPTLAVSRSYLDRSLSHHLALAIDRGEVPPFGLLQVAETVGGADWHPAALDFTEAVTGLLAGLPEVACAATAAMLRQSGELADLERLEQSWFEDDPQVRQIVARGGTRGREKLISYLLQSTFARRRDKWADLFLRTALWMREASADADLCWPELAVIAKAVAQGQDLTEIGLMHAIAERTIDVLAYDGLVKAKGASARFG